MAWGCTHRLCVDWPAKWGMAGVDCAAARESCEQYPGANSEAAGLSKVHAVPMDASVYAYVIARSRSVHN